MKFVTFRQAGAVRAGILRGDGTGAGDRVIDLTHPSIERLPKGVEPQVVAFLDFGIERIADTLAAVGDTRDAEIPIADVELLAPLPSPRRIFGIAHNYRDALAERGMPPPAEPVLFMKSGRTVIGPGQAVALPQGIGGCTYEAELAAVIGRDAENVSADQALSHVAAYGVFNDVSASEMIRLDGNFDRGKNLPTFGPFGPFLSTADEVGDPQDLDVWLSIDGTMLQKSSTSQMLYSVAELVSFLSHRTVLRAGDVIASGTPAGVAPVRRPPTWLRAGTTVKAAVEKLGILENPVSTAGPLDD